jgi:hypothetical protein
LWVVNIVQIQGNWIGKAFQAGLGAQWEDGRIDLLDNHGICYSVLVCGGLVMGVVVVEHKIQ